MIAVNVATFLNMMICWQRRMLIINQDSIKKKHRRNCRRRENSTTTEENHPLILSWPQREESSCWTSFRYLLRVHTLTFTDRWETQVQNLLNLCLRSLSSQTAPALSWLFDWLFDRFHFPASGQFLSSDYSTYHHHHHHWDMSLQNMSWERSLVIVLMDV